MKAAAIVLSALCAIGTASPAHAQLGSILGKAKKIGDKAADTKQKFDDMNINDKEERQLGEQVSLKLRQHFGVFQDQDVTKYVSLVGTALAQASSRPKLDWQFIVLDTDGVNAYAAPGGFIHITRGLLGLMKSESELAGVLGHEITHVTGKHTVNSIEKTKRESFAVDTATAGKDLRTTWLAKLGEKVFNDVLDGQFSQSDENNADETGIRVANQVGYAPSGMVEVLKKIDARNGGREDRNGMFASHPATRSRIRDLEKQIAAEKLTGTATVAARYKQHITFEAKPVNEIAMDVSGAAGLASGDKKKDDKSDDKKKKEDEKKKGADSISSGKQTLAQQQTSSAGARGGLPDRDAKGGSNPNVLSVKVTAAELEAFKKGIVA
jgi:predicted Zn-dependent protease